jgi:hypothetical protein
LKRSIFIIAAILYLSLVFAAGIKEVTNYTVPTAEVGGYHWGTDGSLIFVQNYPSGAEVQYVPPGLPPSHVYSQTLPTDGADYVMWMVPFENTDVFAARATWGSEHTIFGYKTGKKIVETGKIQWHDDDYYGYPASLWRDDKFFFMTLTDTLDTVDVHMYNKNFKLKMDTSFECDTNNYGYPPVWPSPHGRYLAIDQLSTVTATLEADIFRTGRKPRLMGELDTQGSIHFAGPKDNFIEHVTTYSPTSMVWEVVRIGSLNKIAAVDIVNVSSFKLNTKGKGSVGVVDTNNMLTIQSEKGTYGPFAIPEAGTNDEVYVAHYYGSDIILLFHQTGNQRIYGYKVSKKGLKKKTGPETYSMIYWFISSGKYLSVLHRDGTTLKNTIFTTKLKTVGTVPVKVPSPPRGRAILDIRSDPTNTKFIIYKW